MSQYCSEDVTSALDQYNPGEPSALAHLINAAYDELSRIAHRQMRRERSGHTLQTGALVNEAYLRLRALRDIRWRDRNHFLGVAAGVMRRVLVDRSRANRALRRGGDELHVTLHDDQVARPDAEAEIDVETLDRALERLSERDELQARIVELRYFAGLTIEETASALRYFHI